jgi:hypothetical protein
MRELALLHYGQQAHYQNDQGGYDKSANQFNSQFEIVHREAPVWKKLSVSN